MRKVLFASLLSFLALPVLADPFKVAALGDSLTQGYGLPQQDGFVPQLQRWLDGQGADIELINAGVSGDTTAGGAARIGWTLSPDIDGVIVALGGNDLLRGIEPANSRANLTAILSAARDADVAVLLVGMEAPANYGPDYKQQFDTIYPELAQEFDVHLVESFFVGLPNRDDPAALIDYMQADRLHPNARGVAAIVPPIGEALIAVSVQ